MVYMNYQKINCKGQADTVFEVLITVILLSFVMLVGSYAMTSLSSSKCSKEIDISLSSLSQIIVKTASSPLSSQYYLLALPRCFGGDSTVSVTQFVNEQYICNHYCPGSLGSCYLLKYENKSDKVSPLRYMCINISALTKINNQACTNNSPEGYTTIDFANGGIVMQKGKYYIASQSITEPTICIYGQNQPS